MATLAKLGEISLMFGVAVFLMGGLGAIMIGLQMMVWAFGLGGAASIVVAMWLAELHDRRYGP